MTRWICAFSLFVAALAHSGEIVPTSDFSLIEEAAKGLDPQSLILFDVDGTLIVPDDAILKPKNKALFQRLIAGCTDRDLFRETRQKAPHSLVDIRSIALVLQLQEKNIPVLAFTAAPAKISGSEFPGDWRVDELQRYGFNFKAAFPSCNVLEIPKNPEEAHFPLFKAGVLFSSLHPKGDILIAFLQLMNLKPTKVIFVDDELEYVKSVVMALEKHGIECIGFHYTAAEEMPCDVNFEMAALQIAYFIENDIWLGDSECEPLLTP